MMVSIGKRAQTSVRPPESSSSLGISGDEVKTGACGRERRLDVVRDTHAPSVRRASGRGSSSGITTPTPPAWTDIVVPSAEAVSAA